MKLVYFVIVAVLIVVVYISLKLLSGGELADKHVYAALQGVELKHRNKVEAAIVYEEMDGIALAGFSISSKERVWVVLDFVKKNGELFVIPDRGAKLIPCRMANQVIVSKVIDPEVGNILRSSCGKLG